MSRPSRGFSLPELLISLVVSSLVIAAALALMSAQQRTFKAGTDERQLQEGGRIAIDELASNLRNAGFGIDPALAFDFGPQGFYPQPQAPAGLLPSNPGYRCDGAVQCRDRIDGSDEIVFRMRNPRFGHYLTKAATTAQLTVNGPLTGGLKAGQVLQVVCQSGAYTWAYVTVDRDVAPVTAAVEVVIPLRGGNGATYPRQNAFLTGTCYQAVGAMPANTASLEAAAKVLKVDTYRYFVQLIGGRPYLMLDSALDDPDTVTMVAPDVEDLQFTYLFPNAPPANRQVAATPGTRLAALATGIDLAPGAGYPTYTSSVTDPVRTTHYPSNIRAVQVSATVRAPLVEGASVVQGIDQLPAAANRPALPAATFRRFLIETSVTTRNLDARAPYYPVWETAGTTFNLGGG